MSSLGERVARLEAALCRGLDQATQGSARSDYRYCMAEVGAIRQAVEEGDVGRASGLANELTRFAGWTWLDGSAGAEVSAELLALAEELRLARLEGKPDFYA